MEPIYPREIGRYHTLFKVVNFTVQVVFLERGRGSLGAGFIGPAMSYELPGVRLRRHKLMAEVLAFSCLISFFKCLIELASEVHIT